MSSNELPIPAHFDRGKVAAVWRVPYQERAAAARSWAKEHHIPPASEDTARIGLLLVDCQNTFCTPGFELFVAGRSGQGAVDDSIHIVEFIYRNLNAITEVTVSLDTHVAAQIFHPLFLVDDQGRNPEPYTEVSLTDVSSGRWHVNPAVAGYLGIEDVSDLQAYLQHYCHQLERTGKYRLMIWPYHAMLGGTGHALVAAVEEAVFFHAIARQTQTRFETKGAHALTENYSVFGPEVTKDNHGRRMASENVAFIERLLGLDAVIIAGQAKSHCLAWTLADLQTYVAARNPVLAEKVYLLEDCTSPVVAPGGIDFTEQADEAFQRFAAAGMHLVKSTDPIPSWPGMSG